ncbi:MAG: hypothetical protein GKR93_11000 [Gammaproteobacteria bacterium]|nr:hypothetical protein [Gammaproteobacteria bacterium]
MYYRSLLSLPVLLVFLAGCQSSFGPQALERTHLAYNEAIVTSVNEQMLQNLVRIRYRDVPFFLEIGSVTASLSLGANAGLDSGINFGGADSLSPDIGISYSDNPTISYTPLQGENLLKSILSPLQLESILVLTQSGWSISRVFGLCLERINDLYNAPTASGPTPETEPDFREFNQLLALLQILQSNRLLEMGSRKSGETSEIIIKLSEHSPDFIAQLKQVYKLLDLQPDLKSFTLNTDFLHLKSDQWTVRPRSMLSLLYYLAQNIDIPVAHQNAGLVTQTTSPDGGRFDWAQTPAGKNFQIHSSTERPPATYIATYYRGNWFYIDDKDLKSKSTFILLRQLFDLQAGQTRYEGPTLTLPVGGR